MGLKLMTGNDALAWGAVHAGVKVAAGYPGTPSTGALASLLAMDPPGVHVEWSVNEKVAFEVAAGAAWAGQRALCTMKMAGVNVAFDSLISVAYSGTVGGLVIYVADDPGASAGMAEQDSRGFAIMSDLPMLDPSSPDEIYRLTRVAFDLSEKTGSPVFIRLVTANCSSHAGVHVDDDPPAWPQREAVLIHDINKFTKAGSAICMQQHRDLIARLEEAGRLISEAGLNRLEMGQPRGLGVVVGGVVDLYLDEAFGVASRYGFDPASVSILRVKAVHPFPAAEVRALLSHCDTILVLEELEPHLEKAVYVEAHRVGFEGRIVGKLDGVFERIGEYGVSHVLRGIAASLGLDIPSTAPGAAVEAEKLAAARPITVCAGCPHRGTFMAINAAIKKSRFKKQDVMVTGDIGCTILGMNAPFNTVSTEVSMGASLGIAQGYVRAGVKTPVIATIGDSTFFHAGIPALLNAVQHQTPLTLVILDNGWTAMTGMQVNPGTCEQFQRSGDAKLDIAKMIPALGIDRFWVVRPYNLEETTRVITEAITQPGVKVVLAREECTIPAKRRGLEAGSVRVAAENCNLCKLCVIVTGCPAISLGPDAIVIDDDLCYGCGLCVTTCNRDAIRVEGRAP
ncbi:MAG: thiamine pyrophosphate-dependent enzyme [Vicinamibacterales bacterium]